MATVKGESEKKTSTKRKTACQIYDEECMKDRDLAAIVSFPKMRRQLHRIQNSRMPKNTSTPSDIKLVFEDYEMSKHADKLFYKETII